MIPAELQEQINESWWVKESWEKAKIEKPETPVSPQKRYQAKLRSQAIEKLGGKCERCGYDKVIGLLVTRKTSKKEGWYSIYHAVLMESPDYELLCLNCQREKERGCPDV
jgi:hypothetical protein